MNKRHRLLCSKKLFIFDLDGTLVDAYSAISQSLNFTLKNFGYPTVSTEEVKRKVGRGDRLFIQTFFRKKDIPEALRMYRIHHKRSLRTLSRLLPHAKRVLDCLKRQDKILAIASNRPRYYTRLILRTLGMLRYFDMVLCADEIRCRKPHPRILHLIMKQFALKKENSIYVGDMDIDLEAARRAGIDAIFVKGGSSTLRQVARYKNKIVVSTLKDIAVMCANGRDWH